MGIAPLRGSETQLDLLKRHGLRGMVHDGLLNPAVLDKPDQKQKLDDLIDRVYTTISVDQLLAQANTTADPTARAALYNQVDQQLASNEVTVIPLFQKPTQLGYKNTKYLTKIVFLPERNGGYWSDRGYEWYGGV